MTEDKRHKHRIEHIRKLKVAIKTKDEIDSIDTVLSQYMLAEGISLRKLREYVKILLLSGNLESSVFDKSNIIKR